MGPASRPPHTRAVLPLIALAGCVDAMRWLRLQALFVGFMGGTSTLLGRALAGGDPSWAVTLGTALVVGAVAGAAVEGRWPEQALAVPALFAALLAAIATVLGLRRATG